MGIIARWDGVRFLRGFSSPFIQTCLYGAFVGEIKENQERSMIALDPLDALEDVTSGSILNLPALLKRYKYYLERLKEKGLNPLARSTPKKK